jgi:hypothetical protein
MPQTAALEKVRIIPTLHRAPETVAERNLRLYDCPPDQTPNAETPSAETPNAETIAAMQECDDMRSGKIPKYSMPVTKFFEELGIEL